MRKKLKKQKTKWKTSAYLWVFVCVCVHATLWQNEANKNWQFVEINSWWLNQNVTHNDDHDRNNDYHVQNSIEIHFFQMKFTRNCFIHSLLVMNISINSLNKTTTTTKHQMYTQQIYSMKIAHLNGVKRVNCKLLIWKTNSVLSIKQISTLVKYFRPNVRSNVMVTILRKVITKWKQKKCKWYTTLLLCFFNVGDLFALANFDYAFLVTYF